MPHMTPNLGLHDLLSDPLIQILMNRDGVSRSDVLSAVGQATRHRHSNQPSPVARLDILAGQLNHAVNLLESARSAPDIREALTANRTIWARLAEQVEHAPASLPPLKQNEIRRHADFVLKQSEQSGCPNDHCIETFISLGRRVSDELSALGLS